MTDRVHSFTVILEENLRDDDAEPALAAIRQIRGVLSVEPNVADVNFAVATARAYDKIRTRVFDALAPEGGTLRPYDEG